MPRRVYFKRILRLGFLFVVVIIMATYTANLSAILNRPAFHIEGPKSFTELKGATVCVVTADTALDDYVEAQVGMPMEGGLDAVGFMGEMGFAPTTEHGENGDAGTEVEVDAGTGADRGSRRRRSRRSTSTSNRWRWNENGEEAGEAGEGGERGEGGGGDGGEARAPPTLNAKERMQWCHAAVANGTVDAWYDTKHSLHSYMLDDCAASSNLALSSTLSFIPIRFGIVFRSEDGHVANDVTSAMQHIESIRTFAATEDQYFKTGEVCSDTDENADTDVISIASMWGLFLVHFTFCAVALLSALLQVLYHRHRSATRDESNADDGSTAHELRSAALQHNATDGQMLRYLIKAIDDLPKKEDTRLHLSYSAPAAVANLVPATPLEPQLGATIAHQRRPRQTVL